MINGAVVNNGVNYGSQTGVSLPAYAALRVPPHLTINGTVFNNGTNRGWQTGVFIR